MRNAPIRTGINRSRKRRSRAHYFIIHAATLHTNLCKTDDATMDRTCYRRRSRRKVGAVVKRSTVPNTQNKFYYIGIQIKNWNFMPIIIQSILACCFKAQVDRSAYTTILNQLSNQLKTFLKDGDVEG